jgi:hypothetical protein
MKRNLQTLAVPAAIAASFLFGCSSQQKITDRTDPTRPSVVQTQEGYDTFGRKWYEQPPQVLSRSEFMVQSYTGTITDIDYSTREVTLQDAQGRLQTFVVDKNVQRFNEAKVGDKVSVDYYLGYNAEVRKPTAEEAQNPLVVLEATGRAAPDQTPSAHGTRQTRAVVTIEGLDRPNQTLTVKGPRGQHYVARVADPSRFDQVHVGDTIVMTFFEATVISLKPAGT